MNRTATVHVLLAGAVFALLLSVPRLLDAQARERVLYVNAFEKDTLKPVSGLGPSDFSVREDGAVREVLRVTPATSPMPVAVVIDNSQATQPAISDIRRALTGFLTAMNGVGPIALITVADRPTIVTEYTTSAKALEDGVGRIFSLPGSGATLLDGIRETAQGLARRESDRAAIVLLTTENTEFSTLHYDQVLDALRSSRAQLHAVIHVNTKSDLLNDEVRNRSTVLDRGPRESGGVRVDVLATIAFETRMRDLAGILRSQYRVTYARPESLIPPEKIQVSATRAGIEASGALARDQAVK
jgi:hypothetical protein